MSIKGCLLTNLGCRRDNNEDSILVSDTLVSEANMTLPECFVTEADRQAYCVADGMGGHAKGEIASKTALTIIQKQCKSVNQGDDISHIVASIKSRLNDLVRANPGQRDMGTTVSGMIVIGSKALIINCGDSRVYRLNGQFLEKITKDHSIVQNLFDNGDITDDEMRTHPKKHVLTSALIGDLKPDVPEFFIKELSLQPGQRYLICSDGLWESMSLENMESCFVRDDLFEGTACLLQTALNNAAGDNISIIALEVMQ